MDLYIINCVCVIVSQLSHNILPELMQWRLAVH